MAILAGGLATRLGPMTAAVPKSMLPVAGEPFVAHQLRRLASEGFGEVVLCAGHLGRLIEDFVGDGSVFGCRVRYSFDGERLLGTGGALRQALPLLGESFLVMYGDSYLREAFGPVWKAFCRSGKAALMTVFENEDRWDRSNVAFRGGRIVRYDKAAAAASRTGGEMRHIDYGLGCIRSARLASWATQECFDLASFYTAMAERGELAGFAVKERFYEIGSLAGLAEADALLSRLPARDGCRR